MASTTVFELFEQVSSSFSSLLDDEGSDIDDNDQGDSSLDELTEMLGTVSLKRMLVVARTPLDRLPPCPAPASESRRGGRERSATKKCLSRGPMPILKTRIPRDLQAVFLASQRGETVHVPPQSGTAFREFKRIKGVKEVVFDALASPRSGKADLPRMPKRRSCRWGSQAPLEPKEATMPRHPGRSHRIHFRFSSSSSSDSPETSPSLPRRSTSPARRESPEDESSPECCRATAWPIDSHMSRIRCPFHTLVAGPASAATTRRGAPVHSLRHAQQQQKPRLPQRSRSPDGITTR